MLAQVATLMRALKLVGVCVATFARQSQRPRGSAEQRAQIRAWIIKSLTWRRSLFFPLLALLGEGGTFSSKVYLQASRAGCWARACKG
eukprot:12903227-Prorocentrum_lima.AAC.1